MGKGMSCDSDSKVFPTATRIITVKKKRGEMAKTDEQFMT